MFIRNVLWLCSSLLSLRAQAAALPAANPATALGPRDAGDDADVYDAIVVGGGPSGLSALSGLARVRRKAILIDSGEYRNAATRHMHDVIGLDGITGQYYRWLARSKLADYDTITMINGTVTSAGLAPQDSTTDAAAAANPTYTARVTHPSGEEAVLTARSIVLATGLKDDIPSSPPGLQENWGQAVFWCPWCDGHEHADQPLGILGSLADVPGLVREVSTLNTDVVAFVNGTDTPSARAAADASFAGWETYLAARNVTVYNQTLASLTRLRDGFNASMDPSLPTYPEYDLFRVDLDDGTSLERAAFFTDFPDEQRSTLARDMGVEVQWGRLAGVQSKGYLTNLPLVYAVGDNNIDNSTNVPHALYSGKRAAVYLHVALARQESTAEIAAAGNNTSSALAERGQESRIDHRDVWDRMNGSPDDFFYAGHFE